MEEGEDKGMWRREKIEECGEGRFVMGAMLCECKAARCSDCVMTLFHTSLLAKLSKPYQTTRHSILKGR